MDDLLDLFSTLLESADAGDQAMNGLADGGFHLL